MALDIIYPIILTPIAFAVGYGIHAFRKSMKQELPEAKPYEFCMLMKRSHKVTWKRFTVYIG